MMFALFSLLKVALVVWNKLWFAASVKTIAGGDGVGRLEVSAQSFEFTSLSVFLFSWCSRQPRLLSLSDVLLHRTGLCMLYFYLYLF